MKFIKRLLFILILLLAAFGVYRVVSPTAAKALLQDMKTFSNDKLGTDFVITTETEEILVETWTILEETGTLIEETDDLQELSDEDELLLGDDLVEEKFWDDTTTPVVEETPEPSTPTTPSVPATTTTTTTTTNTPSSNGGISKQDLIDFQTLFGN